jgi:hypothetical protein
MEETSLVSLQQIAASSTALARREQRLDEAQIVQVGELMANMIAGYPHQSLGMAMEVYQMAFEQLTLEFGMENLETALRSFLTHQKFFPHPSEVREVLEEMAAKVKAKAKADLLAKLPKIGCEKCQGEDGFAAGLVMVSKPGQPRMVDECECKLAWRRAKKELEAKA